MNALVPVVLAGIETVATVVNFFELADDFTAKGSALRILRFVNSLAVRARQRDVRGFWNYKEPTALVTSSAQRLAFA
jgi:hypothetical protein